MDVRQVGVLLIVFVVALVSYQNSLGCGLVFDDHLALETNEDVTDHNRPIFDTNGLFFHDFWGKDLRDEASHKVRYVRPFLWSVL